MSRLFTSILAGLLALTCLAQEPAAGAPAEKEKKSAERGDRGERRGGRRNWDPAQFQKRMNDRLKSELGATDEEWTAIEPLVSAVTSKQWEARSLSQRGGRRWGGGEAAAEVKAVTDAIEAGDAASIKAAVEGLRKAREAKKAEVATAQAQLKEVLTVSQEAKLVLAGILD